MSRTRLLGIDYGSVRIGLAISDPDRKIAFPLDTVRRRSSEENAGIFRKVVEEEEVGQVVVGLPVHLDGREVPRRPRREPLADGWRK